jgi:hypothetical protein
MILDQFWLTDAQFSKIAPHLPTDTPGKARVDDRRVISVRVLIPIQAAHQNEMIAPAVTE